MLPRLRRTACALPARSSDDRFSNFFFSYISLDLTPAGASAKFVFALRHASVKPDFYIPDPEVLITSTRAQRRAEERKRVKDARKAQLNPTAAAPLALAEPEALDSIIIESALPQAPEPPSPKGGPKTPEGKAISCLNAVKTGLTGRTVLLSSDDAEAYRHHVAQYFKEWKPGSEREEALVQSLADTDWRIDRIPGLEYGIFALGYVQFADMFPGEAPGMRKLLIEAHTLVVFEKQIRNLHLQHGRLCRQREKDQAELRQLKKERIEQERLNLEIAAKLYLKAKQDRKPFNAADHGFEFSIVEIEEFLDGVRASKIYNRDLVNHQQAAKAA